MRRPFKWLGYLLGLVIVLLVGAAVFITLVVNPNDYRDEIAGAIEKYSGHQVTIEGNITLSVYPWLGIETGALRFANPPGFGEKPLARVTEVGVGVKVLPLLHGQFKVSTVALRGLVVNLVRNKAGRVNWERPIPPQVVDSKALDSTSPAAAEPPSPVVTLADLVVGGIDVKDATIIWDDQATSQRIALQRVNLRVGAVHLPAPFDIALDFDVDSAKPPTRGHLKLAARAQVDLAARSVRADSRLNVTLDGDGLPPGFELGVVSDLVADANADKVELNDLLLTSLGLEASGTISGLNVTVAPEFIGHIKVAPFNLRQLLERLGRPPPRTADPDALGQVSGEFDFQAGLDRLELRQLSVEIDRSKLAGSFQVREFAAPKIGFDVSVDSLDLDAYLAPSAGTSAAAATPAGAAAGAAAQLPMDTLRALNLNGTLRIGAIKVSNLHATGLNVGVNAANGIVEASPVVAKLYQGSYAGSARLDATGEVLRSNVKWELSGVQAGPLLDDLTGDGQLQGVGDVHADLSVVGSDAASMRRSLNGSAQFSFSEGAVTGINVAHILRQALAAIEGAPPPPAEVNQTDFSELSGSVRIDAGIMRNDDLQGKSPLLRVDGDGSIDLPQNTVDYMLNAVLVSSLEGQGGKGLDELRGVSVPIRITGALNQPKIAPDIEEVIKAEVEKQTQKAGQRLERELEKTLGDKLDQQTREKLIDQIPGALNGLF